MKNNEDSWEVSSFLTVDKIHGLPDLIVKAMVKEDNIKAAQRLITAATELLGEDCKGEIELLNAVHRKLDSKEIK